MRGRADSRLVAVTVASIVVAIAAVVFAWRTQRAASEPGDWPERARRDVERVVSSRYVEPIAPEHADRLFDSAMRGYVEGLDPFSRYFTAQERTAIEEDTSGKFAGIGVHAEAVPSGLFVTAVRRAGPADLAGVAPGETIERADGVALSGRSREAMVAMVRGAPETTIELTIRDANGGELRTKSVTRALVESDSVPSVRRVAGAPHAGYVRIAQFTDTTGAETRDALRTLAADGATEFILDLRLNLGGVVQAAVDVAASLLPEKTLVCVARAREGDREYRTARIEGAAPIEAPLVVLVDESSASAAEILAGALQDHGRAVLVGERTYGKFVMQTHIPLAERGALLRLTTARYETPAGRSDQRDPSRDLAGGLMPDVRVPFVTRAEEDALRAEFARQYGPAWRVLGARASAAPPDRQLAAALALLAGGDAPCEPVPPRID